MGIIHSLVYYNKECHNVFYGILMGGGGFEGLVIRRPREIDGKRDETLHEILIVLQEEKVVGLPGLQTQDLSHHEVKCELEHKIKEPQHPTSSKDIIQCLYIHTYISMLYIYI